MEKRARIQAALKGEVMDRIPFALWRHFHDQDRDPAVLAEATAQFARQYDIDLVKLTPSGLYGVEDWGAEIVYPGTEHEAPYLAQPAVTEPGAWRDLAPRGRRALDRELEMIQETRQRLGAGWPMVMTIFSPLTLAYKLAGKVLGEHLLVDPEAVRAGLAVLAQVTGAFAQECLEAGADGFFFASQWITDNFTTRGQYEVFGLPYDLQVLEAVQDRAQITILHLHGTDVFFDLVTQYPVDGLSWHDRETAPSLAEARQVTDQAFVAGLDRRLFVEGPPEALVAQARAAIDQTQGHGLILAPSCVIPTETPQAHLEALAEALSQAA